MKDDSKPVEMGLKSRILKLTGDFRWTETAEEEYKSAGDHFRDVRRVNLLGMRGENTAFHFRYFEITRDGFTSREHHRHAHVILVVRGEGELLVDGQWQKLAFGDVAYVAPDASHQLRNRGEQPFGFVCVVDAQRDQPVVESAGSASPLDSICQG